MSGANQRFSASKKTGAAAEARRLIAQSEETARMGRPSEGRSERIQATITPVLRDWLVMQAENGQSLSDVVFRLLEEQRQSEL